MARFRHEKAFLILFALTILLINPYIRGDGNGYYAYVRSVVIDRDLYFENEYRRGDPAFVRSAFGSDDRLSPGLQLPNGYVRNQWAVGSAVLWSPFFLVAHALVGLLNLLGADIPADGYSAPYRWLVAFGTAMYGFVGLLLAFRLASHLTTPVDALTATIGVWFASSLPAYMYFLPFQAHALAAFAVAVFVWYWRRTADSRSIRQWAVWGLSGGLMIAVYYLNVLLLSIPAWEVVWVWARQRRSAAAGAVSVAFGGAAVVALLPHWVTRWILYGSFLETGYLDEFFWMSPRLAAVAWSPEHGMFLWTPILLFAVAGVVVLAARDSRVGGPCLLTLALFYYTVAAYQNWHGQSAFGSRFFVSLTPIFVLGLASLSREIRGAVPGALIPVALSLLIVWNVGFMFQWGTNIVPNRGPVDFVTVARNQVTVVPRRIVAFGVRYLTAKKELIGEVEREDLIESTGYELKR